MEQIEDKDDDHGRTFTDGVGKISPVALQQVCIEGLSSDSHRPVFLV